MRFLVIQRSFSPVACIVELHLASSSLQLASCSLLPEFQSAWRIAISAYLPEYNHFVSPIISLPFENVNKYKVAAAW
jgi:hypothetical protein